MSFIARATSAIACCGVIAGRGRRSRRPYRDDALLRRRFDVPAYHAPVLTSPKQPTTGARPSRVPFSIIGANSARVYVPVPARNCCSPPAYDHLDPYRDGCLCQDFGYRKFTGCPDHRIGAVGQTVQYGPIFAVNHRTWVGTCVWSRPGCTTTVVIPAGVDPAGISIPLST